jgi:hypothetical protein
MTGKKLPDAALTVSILLAVLLGLRNWQRHRKETRAWLSGEGGSKNPD